MALALLDNRDSFTWNLVQALAGLGQEVRVLERATATLADFQELAPERIVVGPGPGHPRDATLSQALFAAFPGTPMLGVCLGHQALALAAGATIGGSPELAHGRPVEVLHHDAGIFRGLPSPFEAGRYHSLCVVEDGLPPELEVTARSPLGEVLALRHRAHPHVSVQFHPESILCDQGPALLANFLGL
ncbi:MAG: aminodeoxychorismate/anthranilate synthase component II [Planctomycetota bacterium]|nr:aminodeoxychorismate/anthranilate synthase component II [Planctomycetota bacterium]